MVLQPGSKPVPNSPDYVLIRKLGAGAFGEVWHAHGPGGVDVALKFIPLDSQVRALELRSLEVMKSIRHPNLVSLFGAWHRDNWLILAMELCDRSLQDRLAEALDQNLPGIPLKELLTCMSDAANGLDALNAKQVQHRDVKPANLLLLDSALKVADFGLAKALEQTMASNSGGGTIAYLAPECFKGKLTQQTDQYSLAVTYYHLRTGRLLFKGDQAQMMYAHLELEPNLSDLASAERVVLARALSKEPDRRWQSCSDFVNELCNTSQQEQGKYCASPSLRFDHRQPKEAPAARQHKQPGETIVFYIGHTDTPGILGFGKRTVHATMKFAWIPPGTFLMGSPNDEVGRIIDKEIQHKVTITKGFYLGVYPVTRLQYATFVEETGYKTQAEQEGGVRVFDVQRVALDFQQWVKDVQTWRLDKNRKPDPPRTPHLKTKLNPINWRRPGFRQTNEDPVVCVNWNDCVAFARWITKKETKPFRLPTESEWEYACRAGTTTPFLTGETISVDQANYDGSAKPYGNGKNGVCRSKTTPVGTFPPNAWGLHDMHGNVWESCQDWFGVYPQGDLADPQGPTRGEDRVARGGSWNAFPECCRSAYRVGNGEADSDHGFRLCFCPE